MDYPLQEPSLATTDQTSLVLPVIGAGERVAPEGDRALAAAARRAQAGDRVARNLLYQALAPAIERCVRRYRSTRWRRATGSWDIEDVRQEAFVVFADLVADWPGGDQFAGYFFSRFPWRLRDAVIRTLARPLVPPDVIDTVQLALLADGSFAAEAAIERLEALAVRFEPINRAILLWHVRDGLSQAAIARRLGVNRRTVRRRLEAIRAELRPLLDHDTAA